MFDESRGLLLLNCPKCEDVVRGVEGRTRQCFCGTCIITLDHESRVTVAPRSVARVIEIPWTDYDGARPGSRGSWQMLEDESG